MLSSAPSLLRLLQRETYFGRPAELLRRHADGTLVDEVPSAEAPLLVAAAALNGGEPKRARRVLDDHAFEHGSDAELVARALLSTSEALDRNWFPGGAGSVLEEGDVERVAGQPLSRGSPEIALLVLVATELVAMAPAWRSIVEGSRRSGHGAPAQAVLAHVEQLGHRVAGYGVPAAVGHVALIHADLFWRAGQYGTVGGLLGVAMQSYQAANDVVGVGSCWLAQGDWSAEPLSHPELLGLALERTPAPATVQVSPDPTAARESYARAWECFDLEDAPRGLVAVELRLAHLAGREGDWSTAAAHRERAIELAAAAGDGALRQLGSVHRALASAEQGEAVDADAVGGAVAVWANEQGSYSYARGLARLCLAVAGRRRECGEVLRGRLPLRIADAINSGVGAVLEPALVSDELAQLYGGANYRRAMLVLTELELESATARAAAGPLDAVGWLSLVDKAMRLRASAIALRDPDAIAAASARFAGLLELAPADEESAALGSPAGPVAAIVAVVRSTLAEDGVLVPLYRGTRARATGLPEEAEAHFAAALEAADALGSDGVLLKTVVLATMRRRREGLGLARELLEDGRLPPDFAAELFVRLGDAKTARSELAKLDAIGPPPTPGKPWEVDALRAEIHEALGEWSEAATVAGRAIARFEEHLARLSRDVLRLSAMDDLTVVGLYTTGIRAELARAQAARQALDGATETEALGSALRLSDRCRGVALTDLVALDEAAGTAGDVVEAMRAWHGSGVRLASVFEQIRGNRAADASEARRRIAEAERELDDAEAALHARAPELLEARRRPPASPGLRKLQSLLRPETVLVEYHLFDDELVGWAVSERGIREVRRGEQVALAGDAVRFHRACSDPLSAEDERGTVGERLARTLVEPFARELDTHARVVVVPHGALALLPFHLLPFRDDVFGSELTVSYLPVASVAPRWRDSAAPRLESALVVGDPDYALDRGLRQLAGARAESVAVAGLLSVQPLVGARAGLKPVVEGIAGAHLLHLATHGHVADGAPNSAELALAGRDRLKIADLMGLDTDIDLAVLSACDTGRGSATAGGEIVGLTRALLAAGARDVVVSLWPVDDQAGCLTIVEFYSELVSSGDVAGALAAAQAAVRSEGPADRDARFEALVRGVVENGDGESRTREWGDQGVRASGADPTHPYFWGPFVHIGL